MSSQLFLFFTLLLAALIVAAFLFRLLQESLRELLQRTVRDPSGVTFYLRCFRLVLLLGTLSAALQTDFDMKDAHFMQYVWKWAGGLASVFETAGWFLVIFLVLITILVATLKSRNEQ